MLKQTLIAGAALALAAVPAFAHSHHSSGGTMNFDSFNTSTKTITVTKADIQNQAEVNNMVFTNANTGFNYTSVNGGTTFGGETESGNASKGGTTGDTNGGSTTGGNAAMVTTGDAGAMSTVSNVVNTTSVSF